MIKAAAILSLLFIGAVYGNAINNGVMETGPACPIKDPLTIEPSAINITLSDILVIDVGSTQDGGIATGLSTLSYTYTINLITLTASFQLTVTGTACGSGSKYSATGTADVTPLSDAIFPSGPFNGEGSYFGCISQAEVTGSATIFVNLISNKVSLSRLALTKVVFASAEVELGGFSTKNGPTDWAAWNAGFKAAFDAEFALHNAAVVERIRGAVNGIIGKYTLAEFLELIGSGTTPGPCEA